MLLLPLLSACTSAPAGSYLAYVRGAGEDPDGYTISARSIDSIDDPRRMDGSLGEVRHGGRLVGGTSDAAYVGGEAVAVRFVLEDGVAVPLDQDGLLLFSFYGHLQDARAAVEAHGVDLGPVFPVGLAWNPAVSPLIELSPVDNAAYAVGNNLFLLLPDGDNRDVPLLGNAGVVMHELGHAVLHLLLVGDPLTAPIVQDSGTTEAGMWQASIQEGFADSLAVLLLDDPSFMAPSIDMPARDVDGSATLTEALLPQTVMASMSTVIPIYDPYPLGTVFASMMWDIRQALDDPDATLDLLLAAVRAWDPQTADDMDGFGLLDALAATADEHQRDRVCAAIDRRFGAFHTPPGCE